MEQYLSGRTALVTGAGWGVGTACALIYAAHGARVVVSDSNGEFVSNIVAGIKRNNGTATFIEADLSDPMACEKLVERTISIYGSIDIACNNSALTAESQSPVYRIIEGLTSGLDSKLEGLFYCMKFEAAAMHKKGGGVIVNMSCLPGVAGLSVWSPDMAARYALAATKRHGLIYRARGVRINTVSPDLIRAALLENPNLHKGVKSEILPHDGRYSKIEQVIQLVLWLSL